MEYLCLVFNTPIIHCLFRFLPVLENLLLVLSFNESDRTVCFFFAEDIETSLSDYQKALTILESLVEPDSRYIAELYPLSFTGNL